MIGAIIGDIVGSPYEFNNTYTYHFPWLTPESSFTDDTICTIAIADALCHWCQDKQSAPNYGLFLHNWCQAYPNPKGGYGGRFAQWVSSPDPEPYRSFGNGSAMRVSPIAWAFDDLSTVLSEAERSASVTHNHPEGIKGAVCTAHLIWAGRNGYSQSKLMEIAKSYYPYWRLKLLRGVFDETCQGTLPICFWALSDAYSFNDAIHKAISVGGDSDTIGAIVGSIAETLWSIPDELRIPTLSRLPNEMIQVIQRFNNLFKYNHE